MEKNIEEIVNVLKMQAEAFLIAGKEFYPFGTLINNKDKIVPVGAYLGSDYSPSLPLIDLLEKDFKQGIQNGDYKIAVIAIDVTIKERSKTFDAIEMRFFEADKEVYKKYFKYKIKENSVEFFEFNYLGSVSILLLFT